MTMKILTTISDVRKYRQLGKQVNQDNFDGITREVQENELTEMLGSALSYDFFNYLDNDWTNQLGTFTRVSDTQFLAENLDLSLFVDYALKINDNAFAIIETAVFDGTNTLITVIGYVLPTELSIIDYKQDNSYIKLLNGTNYQYNNKTISFSGLRPFICWKFLSIYITEGSVKSSDVGNIAIMPENRPSGYDLNNAKSIRLQNSTREYNRVINYLDANKDIYPLWESKNNENLTNLEMIII